MSYAGTPVNTCRVSEVPPTLNVARFRKPFQRTVLTPEGSSAVLTLGPGSESWVPYNSISRFMEVAVLTTEDGRFPRHHGFDEEAIVNSIRENSPLQAVRARRQHDSMQLARNLYLGRERTISRKGAGGDPHCLPRAGADQARAHGAVPQRHRVWPHDLRRRPGCTPLLQLDRGHPFP